MTPLQGELRKAIKALDKEEAEYNLLHRMAKRKKQNVIVPMQQKVRYLLIDVQRERSNYNIVSE